MCGIVAIYDLDPGKGFKECQYALSQIAHRGPDASKIIQRGNWAIGVNRLAVIDPENGHQPYIHPATGNTLALNGEIYNFDDLVAGATGDTVSVAEFISKEWINGLRRLDGQFSLFYLSADGQWFAARDPIGIKPLYYSTTRDGGIIFASELKALANYPGPYKTILPGHYFDGKRQQPYIERIPAPSPRPGNLKRLIARAVQKRIPPSGRVAVLLSGGLDSSIIAYEAAQVADVELVTVGTKNSRDLEPSKQIASWLKLPHYIQKIDSITSQDLAKIIWHLENYRTISVSNAIPQYFACQKVKELGIKVVLGGEGADELFGGYDFLDEYGREYFAENRMAALEQMFRNELQRMDRMASAFGLENRVPFLDREVISTAMSYGVSDLIKPYDIGEIKKVALRKSYQDILPSEIANRPKDNMYRSTGTAALLESLYLKKFSQKTNRQVSGWPIENDMERTFYEIFRSLFDLSKIKPYTSDTLDESRVLELNFVPCPQVDVNMRNAAQ